MRKWKIQNIKGNRKARVKERKNISYPILRGFTYTSSISQPPSVLGGAVDRGEASGAPTRLGDLMKQEWE